MAFPKSLVSKLADKVTEEIKKIRNALLRRKAFEKGVLPEDILLSEDTERLCIKEAFARVLSSYKNEFHELKSAVGKELSRRKNERDEYEKAIFFIILSELNAQEDSAQELPPDPEGAYTNNLHLAEICAEEMDEQYKKYLLEEGLVEINDFGEIQIIYKDEP